MAAAEEIPVAVEKGRADRNTAFVGPETRLFDRDIKQLLRVNFVLHLLGIFHHMET
jgi:hypothetical protein